MLSGMGATAKGPPVADVLGSVNKGRERTQDIEKALAGHVRAHAGGVD